MSVLKIVSLLKITATKDQNVDKDDIKYQKLIDEDKIKRYDERIR